MSEAIISRRGYTAEGKPELRTEVITGNTNWTVPNYKKGNISVRIFGGGSSGSGWMNNGEFNNLTPGTNIQITIGAGKPNNNGYANGGTTSFGTYLSANGGTWLGDGGAGGISGKDFNGDGGCGYQFGGAGGDATKGSTGNGGNGGMWGGGGGAGSNLHGGHGGMYGGGGGCGVYPDMRYNQYYGYGGNGGTYGGGGGQCFAGRIAYNENTIISSEILNASWSVSNGGEYGGNGGGYPIAANDGTNTIGNNSVLENLQGAGSSGPKNIWFNITVYNSNYYPNRVLGYLNIPHVESSYGGGGFGGNGGIVLNQNMNLSVAANDSMGAYIAYFNETQVAFSGCGGGGYGGNGGNTTYSVKHKFYTSEDPIYFQNFGGGGGGGYGGNGESMYIEKYIRQCGGGGGGYFSDGDGGGGGGWYNYCHGGGYWADGKYGYGSGAGNSGNAKSGACIIQYWI